MHSLKFKIISTGMLFYNLKIIMQIPPTPSNYKDGFALGTFCINYHFPRHLNDSQTDPLQLFANYAMAFYLNCVLRLWAWRLC